MKLVMIVHVCKVYNMEAYCSSKLVLESAVNKLQLSRWNIYFVST